MGNPEISLTDKSVPSKSSSTENNVPALPITLNTVEPLPITERDCEPYEADTTKDPEISMSALADHLEPVWLKIPADMPVNWLPSPK